MPFITEEIWSKIKDKNQDLLIITKYPETDPNFNFIKEADETALFQEIIYKIRNIRGEMNIAPDRKADLIIKSESPLVKEIVEKESAQLKSLAKIESIKVDASYKPEKSDCSAVIKDAEIYLPLKGLIDVDKELERLNKELSKIEADLSRVEGKLSNDKFISSAPEDIVAKEKTKRDEFVELKNKITESINNLKNL